MKNDSFLNIFIDNDPNWGGTFQYTENIIESLILNNKKKIKIFYTNESWQKKFKTVEKKKIKISFIGRIFFYFSIFLFKDLKILKKIFNLIYDLKAKENDIWIFPSQDLISCIFIGKKIVAVHDLMHLHTSFEESSSFLKKVYREFRYKKIAKNADKIIVDSNYGKFQFLEHYKTNPKKIHVLPFFIKKIKVKEKITIKKFLIYPAKFWKHKNHIKLIAAINNLVKFEGIKDLFILFTSKKDLEYKNIHNYVVKNNLQKNVKFTGYISTKQLAVLYSSARALVMPTFFGPTNIPPIEAFNYSCPVLISDIFASREQCKNSALYFNPNEINQIANKIKDIWLNDNLFLKMRKKSQLISKNYNFVNFSKKLNKIISDKFVS